MLALAKSCEGQVAKAEADGLEVSVARLPVSGNAELKILPCGIRFSPKKSQLSEIAKGGGRAG